MNTRYIRGWNLFSHSREGKEIEHAEQNAKDNVSITERRMAETSSKTAIAGGLDEMGGTCSEHEENILI
jgi:hypothetical protein